MSSYDTVDVGKELTSSTLRHSMQRTDFAICQAYGVPHRDMLSNITVSKRSKINLDHASFASHLQPLFAASDGIRYSNTRPTVIMHSESFWLVSSAFLNSAGFYLCVPIKCRTAAMERLISNGAFEGEINLGVQWDNRLVNGKITPADMGIYRYILKIADEIEYLSCIDERSFDDDVLYSVYDVEAKILDIAAFVGCGVDVRSKGSFFNGYLHCKDTKLFCAVMLVCIATAARYSVIADGNVSPVTISVSEFDSVDRYIDVSVEYDCKRQKNAAGIFLPPQAESKYEDLLSLAREKVMLVEFSSEVCKGADICHLCTRIVFSENPDIGLFGDFKADPLIE